MWLWSVASVQPISALGLQPPRPAAGVPTSPGFSGPGQVLLGLSAHVRDKDGPKDCTVLPVPSLIFN